MSHLLLFCRSGRCHELITTNNLVCAHTEMNIFDLFALLFWEDLTEFYSVAVSLLFYFLWISICSHELSWSALIFWSDRTFSSCVSSQYWCLGDLETCHSKRFPDFLEFFWNDDVGCVSPVLLDLCSCRTCNNGSVSRKKKQPILLLHQHPLQYFLKSWGFRLHQRFQKLSRSSTNFCLSVKL